MKITKIETIPLRLPLETPVKGSHWTISNRCTIVTRVYTDDGLVGECFNGNDDETQAAVIEIINADMSPRLIGMDPLEIERAWLKMVEPSFNFFRDKRLIRKAQSCVDSALWDLKGKAFNAPLHKLWGGHSNSVRPLSLGGYYRETNEITELENEMNVLRQRGVHGVKLKVGGKAPEVDAKRAEAARRGGGDDFALAVDANQGWQLDDARKFGVRIKDLNIEWFEEPCIWHNDRKDMARLRVLTGLPMCAGQSEITREGARDLMVDSAIDYCNFDASWGGGPTEWLKVAATASSFGIKVIQHLEPQIGAALAAAVPHAEFFEVMSPGRDPLFYRLVENQNGFIDGTYELLDGPGWGMILDKSLIEKHRCDQ